MQTDRPRIVRWLEHPRAPLAVVAFALLLALPLTALERVGQRAKGHFFGTRTTALASRRPLASMG